MELEMEIDVGTTPDHPDLETTQLAEEEILCFPEERLCRVLSSFEFRKDGLPTLVPIEAASPVQYEGMEVVGVVGTLLGKEGLFAQCAWFGNHDLDWFWCRITNIQQVQIRADIRFRGGERCAWLCTPYGDYALLLPRITYVDMWEESLFKYGPNGPSARVQIWPPKGVRPVWWGDRWQECWPWDRSSAEPKPALENGWVRLGPRGDTRSPGEPLSHLHHLDPWIIAPNSGKRPNPDCKPEI